MKKTSIPNTLFLFFTATTVGAVSTAVHAEYYPSQYKITNAGFNHAAPLQEKLSTKQGEVFFEKTGIYIGASDVAHQDQAVDNKFYEIDTYAGIKKTLGLFGYHLGLKSYNRALNKNIDVQELYVGGNIQDVSFSYATNSDGEYRQINLNQDISTVNFGFHFGETKTFFGQAFSDWSVSASRAYKKLVFNAIMTKNDNPLLLNTTEFNFGIKKHLSLF